MMKHPYFFGCSVVLIMGWTAVALGYNMPATWYIHHHHHPSMDQFFIHFTWLAEWFLIVGVATIALIQDWKKALWMGAFLGLQAFVVAGIKSGINAPRPIEIDPLMVRKIQNLDIHHWQAFPSGHTAVAFFTMGWLSFLLQTSTRAGSKTTVVLIALAAGIGYSRMYLAQHSLIDVCSGGSLAVLLCYMAFYFGKKASLYE